MQSRSTEYLVSELKQALSQRRRSTINSIVELLVGRAAPLGRHWRSLADIMVHNGEFTLARGAIALFVASEGYSPAALFQEASILARCGNLIEARRIFAALPSDVPDVEGHQYAVGMIEMNLGNLDRAGEHFLLGLKAEPKSGQMWLALSMTTRLDRNDRVRTLIIDAERQIAGAPPAQMAQYFYAQGKAYDEVGEYSKAFCAYEAGAALVAKEREYQQSIDDRETAESVDGWTSSVVAELNAALNCSSGRPIIVTGSPRSGTTLVEHILTSHSAVVGGEEIGRFPLVAQDIGGTSALVFKKWLSSGNVMESAVSSYLHILDERFGTRGQHIVDKTPEASRYLGTFAALFPESPIIWMRRNPLDCAWSCFKTYFAQGVSWSYSLNSIGYHFRLENELMDRWSQILGDRLLIVDYQTLVREPDSMIRLILAHCNLAPEEAVFQPHLSARPVVTSSVAQVRQPINTKGIGSADPYKQYLGAFIDAYYD